MTHPKQAEGTLHHGRYAIGKVDLADPFRHIAIVLGSLERRRQIVIPARNPTGQQQNRNRVGISLGHSTKCIFAAGARLHHSDTQMFAMGGAAITVGHVDQGSLGTSHDRANSYLGASVDQAVVWKTEEILHAFTPEYIGNRVN